MVCTSLMVSENKDWDLAVQTLGLQPGSWSRLFLGESLSLEYSDCPQADYEAFLGIYLMQALRYILFSF